MIAIDELVKRMNARGSKFWSEDTLEFFGDSVGSFALKEWNGKLVLYRKLGTPISVFGRWQYSNRTVGANPWFIEGDDCRILPMSEEEKNEFYDSLEK